MDKTKRKLLIKESVELASDFVKWLLEVNKKPSILDDLTEDEYVNTITILTEISYRVSCFSMPKKREYLSLMKEARKNKDKAAEKMYYEKYRIERLSEGVKNVHNNI